MIHVVGNAAVDAIIRVERFPLPGETIVGRGLTEDLGGKGANQAIIVARCGEEVRLVAAVGADAAADRIRRNLAAERVGIDGVRAWSGASDRCVIYVDRDGENEIVSVIDAALNFDPISDHILEGAVAPRDWMVLQGNLQASVTRACLGFGKANGAITVLNPSPVYSARDYDWSMVDLVVLNRGEAIALGGRQEPVEAARALLAQGTRTVVLTLGAEGATLLSDGETLSVKAPEVQGIDSTGAGDVFCGTLVAARAKERSWREALLAAARAAAICVARAGVLASFPTRGELTEIFLGRLIVEVQG